MCLLYHRVNDIEDSVYNITVSSQNFENHMKYIKENYNCLRFDEDWTKESRLSVAITFDDGYADNYENVLPILEKYGIPATIFVTTGNLGTKKEFWWDEVERLLTAGNSYPEKFTLKDPVLGYTWETDTFDKRKELVKTIRWLLRMEVEKDTVDNWLEQLREWANLPDVGRKDYLALNNAQLEALSKSKLITIGAHTVNHMSLGAMAGEQQYNEIKKSLSDIARIIGKVPEVFSYPFGMKNDYNMTTLKICEELGIRKAATTCPQLYDSKFGKLEIPRRTIRNWNIEELKKNMQLFWRNE